MNVPTRDTCPGERRPLRARRHGPGSVDGNLIQQISASPPTLESLLYFTGVLVIAWLGLVVTRRALLRIVYRITERTKATWDDQLRIAPEFGLRIFQQPAGSDLAGLADRAARGGYGGRVGSW